MFNKRPSAVLVFKICLLSLFPIVFAAGCSVAAESEMTGGAPSPAAAQSSFSAAPAVETAPVLTKNTLSKGRIEIKAGSPADAVRSFYGHLREGRFREALMMTNLRPAIEPLAEVELKDFESDFEVLARQVPADIPISGEIITGDEATVTARLPNEDNGKPEDKIFRLRREGAAWVFLTADEKTEAAVKRQGKEYFYNLRFDIHHTEAQAMLERVAKAQGVYALQTGGEFADMTTLIAKGLLAEDIQSPASTGYNYNIYLSFDKKRYYATAEPAVYGKTGRLSFMVEAEGAAKKARLKSKDNRGAPLKN
jgi:hypothetical protein